MIQCDHDHTKARMMKKSILYRLFKLGRVPKRVRSDLEAEGHVLCDEGLSGSFYMRKLRRPYGYHRHRVEGFVGGLVLTRRRVYVYVLGQDVVHLLVTDEQLKMIYVKLLKPERLQISFETSNFLPKYKGVLRVRYNTSQAQEFHDQFLKLGMCEGEPQEG